MPWTPNTKKGVDLPVWDWLAFLPDPSNPGGALTYDGKRFIYIVNQYGTTALTANTARLWRYDTWDEGFQLLAVPPNLNVGTDIEYDGVRNILILTNGTLTSWQVFNLNTAAVTVAGVVCNPWVLTTMTPVLPVIATTGASLTLPDDLSSIGDLTPNGAVAIDNGTITGTASTTTTLNVTDASGTFGFGMQGLYARFTSGALAGQRRQITAVNNRQQIVTAAFTAPPAAGDVFVIELPEGTATAGSTTVLTDTNQAWTVNLYADSDVVIIAGTGIGQRRRIASNTATTLTLAAAVTGNPRTGPFATAPDATSVYRIVPSSDFLYYQVGGATGLHRIDLATSAATTWVARAVAPAASGGGGNTFHAGIFDPFSILMFQGAGAAGAPVRRFQIGLNAWASPTVFVGAETFSTGASSCMMHGKRRLFVHKEGQPRTYLLDLTTGMYEPGPTIPYIPALAYEGKRSKFVTTPDGVQWLYHIRAGGQEFFRVPVDWL